MVFTVQFDNATLDPTLTTRLAGSKPPLWGIRKPHVTRKLPEAGGLGGAAWVRTRGQRSMPVSEAKQKRLRNMKGTPFRQKTVPHGQSASAGRVPSVREKCDSPGQGKQVSGNLFLPLAQSAVPCRVAGLVCLSSLPTLVLPNSRRNPTAERLYFLAESIPSSRSRGPWPARWIGQAAVPAVSTYALKSLVR